MPTLGFLIIVTLWELFTPALAHLSDLKILLSILADLDNAVVWMVTTCPLVYTSSSAFIKPLLTVPSAPTTTGITVTFMFHNFLVLWQGLPLFSRLSFFVDHHKVWFSGLGDPFVSQNLSELYLSHSPEWIFMPDSIRISCVYILLVCISDSSSYSFFANKLIYMRLLISSFG